MKVVLHIAVRMRILTLIIDVCEKRWWQKVCGCSMIIWIRRLCLQLTSSGAFPMNLPFFHQVIVAGGLDPELLQINVTDFDTDNGSVGFTNSTFVGSTANENVIIIGRSWISLAFVS